MGCKTDLAITTDEAGVLAHRLEEHPLDRMFAAGLIDEERYDAGGEFAQLYMRAGIAPRRVGQLSDTPRSSGEVTDGADIARKRWQKMASQLGTESSLVIDVVCEAMQPGQRQALRVADALERLVDRQSEDNRRKMDAVHFGVDEHAEF